MKKLLLALPLAAGASWAGTTYYSGTQTQPAYHQLLAQLNESQPLLLESESYTAGFTHSKAITTVKMADEDEVKVLFRLQHDINHSPIGTDPDGARFSAANITTTILLDESSGDLAQKIMANTPLVMHSDIGFDGRATHNLHVDAIDIDEDDVKLSFTGADIQAVIDANYNLISSGTIGALEAVFSKEGAEVSQVSISPSSTGSNLDFVSNGIYTGDSHFSIPSITVKKATIPGESVVLNDLTFKSLQQIDEAGLLSSVGDFNIANIKAPIPLTAMKFHVGLNGLSPKGMSKFITVQKDHVQTLTAHTEADNEAYLTFLQEAFAELITDQFVYDIDITASNDGGDVKAKVQLQYLGDGSANGFENIHTLRDLLQATIITANLDADNDAIMQTPAAMLLMDPSPMVSQFIVNDGDKFTSSIKVADVHININGELQALDVMLGEKLDEPFDLM